ncbi:hypothetical protein POV27_13240 [Aureisphaera galaxeae]|uniref:hypothetical protein n=1 Tax=Aureisphaera galaxeae TaxID=1538023 RepID=UPI002350A402|nr:hypothetical protein [Aureisphaera galaxeae]MDC8005020.1 hypothetical protein [Aureisphaera galaxeae]
MHIQDLQGNWVHYTYQEDRDYSTIADRFVRNTLIAIDFLYRTDTLTIRYEDEGEVQTVDIIDVLVADTENDIKIIPGQKNAYNPNINCVMFYDTHGVVFRKNHKKKWFRRNKGYNSPVALLSHELIHCYNELYETEDYLARKRDHSSRGKKIDADGRDLSFPNAEEVFVIKMTNQVAKRLGEDKRSNYGRSYYPVEHVLSTKPKKGTGRV